MKRIKERQTDFEIIIRSLLQLALITYSDYKDLLGYTSDEQLDNVCYYLQELLDNDYKFKE